MPGSQPGESYKTCCSMHADCSYQQHHYRSMRTSLWEPRSFRPHSKDCTRVTKEQANVQNRVSAYNPRSAQPTRPTVNAVGDLLYVEKNKCKKCGQYGHSKGTCQGKGYIGSITDAMQAEVYEQRNEEASATRKRKRAAGRVDTE